MNQKHFLKDEARLVSAEYVEAILRRDRLYAAIRKVRAADPAWRLDQTTCVEELCLAAEAMLEGPTQ